MLFLQHVPLLQSGKHYDAAWKSFFLSSIPINNMFFVFHPSGSTFCQPASSRSYTDSTKNTTHQELWALLNSIHLDTKISAKERKRLLGQFYQAHPEIYYQYYGEFAVGVL